MLKITTNNKPRELVSFFDLPEKAQSDFDYVEECDRYSARFVQYRKSWYDVHDTQMITVDNGRPMGWTMLVDKNDPMANWDSIVSETYFSGVLFKLVGNDDVICGRYCS